MYSPMDQLYTIKPSSDIYKALLLQSASTIVWKDQTKANACEKGLDLYYPEIFMGAKRGILNFDVIRAFDEEIIAKLGFTGDAALPMLADKKNIPEELRPTAVKFFTEKMIAKDHITGYYKNYVEENEYYRMLTGLPPLNSTEKDWVYVEKFNTEWPMDVPIHKMSMAQRLRMEQKGYLDELIKAHPDKKYLKYAGKKGIDVFAARAAERFDLLYAEFGQATFETDFRESYNKSKFVVNAVYYSAAFKKANELYDNFLAMSILFMTIHQMFRKYLAADVTRDFYDVESIRYIYDSYGVPYYDQIPLAYHTKIAKKMNRLLSYKGSSTVFFDLFELFDSSSMNIYTYYLTKTHKFLDGKPVFVRNKDGTIDERATYDIAFAKGAIHGDPALEVTDPSNKVAFPDLTYNDPYWVNDFDLFEKVYGETYNYAESKYLGLQAILDILGDTYRNCYFVKMLQDNREFMEVISVQWAVTNAYTSLFDFFLYMAALYCKKFSLRGELTDDLAYTASVLGYDFKNAVTIFQEHIVNDPILSKDEQLIKLVQNMDVHDLNSVNDTFINIWNLRQLLVDVFTETHDMKVYEAYRGLYDILLTSENMRESFTMSDGHMASSYEEMLSETNPALYQRLEMITIDSEEVDLEVEIRSVISQIESMIPAIKSLDSIYNMEVSTLIESLFKILQHFKSAKAELIGYNVVYVLSLRGVNFFKMMDRIVSITEHVILKPDDLVFQDVMNYIEYLFIQIYDVLGLLEDKFVFSHYHSMIKDHIHFLLDQVRGFHDIIHWNEEQNIQFTDFIVSEASALIMRALLMFGDKTFIIHEVFMEPKYSGLIKDQFHFLIDDLFTTLGLDAPDAHQQSIMILQDFAQVFHDFGDGIWHVMDTRPLLVKDKLLDIAWDLVGAYGYITWKIRAMLCNFDTKYYKASQYWGDSLNAALPKGAHQTIFGLMEDLVPHEMTKLENCILLKEAILNYCWKVDLGLMSNLPKLYDELTQIPPEGEIVPVSNDMKFFSVLDSIRDLSWGDFLSKFKIRDRLIAGARSSEDNVLKTLLAFVDKVQHTAGGTLFLPSIHLGFTDIDVITHLHKVGPVENVLVYIRDRMPIGSMIVLNPQNLASGEFTLSDQLFEGDIDHPIMDGIPVDLARYWDKAGLRHITYREMQDLLSSIQ